MTNEGPPNHWENPDTYRGLDNLHRFTRQATRMVVRDVFTQATSPSDTYPIVELGAGPVGLYADAPHEYARRLVMTDKFPANCEKLRKNHPTATVQLADINATPFGPSSQRLVVARSAFHVLPRLDIAAQEMARILEPGGKFIHMMNTRIKPKIVMKGLVKNFIPIPNPDRIHDLVVIPRDYYEGGIRNYFEQILRSSGEFEVLDAYARDPLDERFWGEGEHTERDLKIVYAHLLSDIVQVKHPVSTAELFGEEVKEVFGLHGLDVSVEEKSAEVIVPRNEDHSSLVLEDGRETDNNFYDNIGKLYADFDPSIADNHVRERATLQVITATKK